MHGLEDKFDSALRRIHWAYQRRLSGAPAGRFRSELPVPDDGLLNVTLQYDGDLATIVPLGFTPIAEEGPGRATGTIDLGAVDALVGSDQVISLRFGEPMAPSLDLSVPDVRANAVWTLAGGVFTGTTGKGVLVGVVDTGIDWGHRFFLSSTAPPTTRILRIWDPGLEVVGGEKTPLGAGLAGAPDYGVEYRDTHINDRLRGVVGAPAVRHVDCVGHGTHCASIAAGDGRDAFTFVGVAPEADIIMVKLLDLQHHPDSPVPPFAPLPFDQIFRDAVDYLFKVADDLGRPLVISMSLGSDAGPHDGFTDREDFLTHTFDPALTGKVCVIAAGNAGGKRQHARIVFPAAATVDVPLELFDDRGAKKLEYRACANVPGTRSAGAAVWYQSGGATLTGAIRFPATVPFVAGPALGAVRVTGTHLGRDWQLTNATETQVLRSGAGSVVRNEFEFLIEPHLNRHVLGAYTLRLTSSGPMTVHLWCRSGRREGMKLADAGQPPEVHVEDEALVGDPGGAGNTITVAAYDAETQPTVPITTFSSRGLLAAHGALPVVQPDKPDLAAPGKSVDAAKSRSAAPWGPALTTPKNGTSMATPHVAGAVALMLQKKPALTVADALATLRGQARTAPPVTPQEAGSGRLDVKDSFDNVPP
ncbi:S8 family serine peptidase [Paractinoplanes brasiliensis]|uniref:Subtilase family protein n=1 Tax=Paractinoplanes brasiliensis TaxID=52695 RepID=A0A4R6JYF4_9ACTN|nr:S8 family serine peptidase [Actinoplanes brasiliensis]TDO41860.1 subtilase family protein [Actinoplanes brasiliensis]